MNCSILSIFSFARKIDSCIKIHCIVLTTSLLLLSTFSFFCQSAEIAPDREIAVDQSSPEIPDWKILWDRARALAKDGLIESAADTYASLFQIKSNIEEANWEYCKILLEIQSYDVASKIISLLLENNPNKIEYLLVAGQVAAHLNKYAEAERYFGLIFEKDPSGKYGDAALGGLTESLRARGLIHLSFPLMQQLAGRNGVDSILLKQLAEDAVALGRYNEAETYYRRLIEDHSVDDSTLLQAAEVYEVTENEDLLEKVYLPYLRRHPDYLPFRLNILEASEKAGDYEAAIEQLLFIIDLADPADTYLLRAAHISENYLGRLDRALGFYQKYLDIHPGDQEVLQIIEKLQKSMALEFQIIVENGGAAQLWNDLEKLGQSRAAIFNRMAVNLERERKTAPLVELLETLYENGAAASETASLLAAHYYRGKNYTKSLLFLDGVEPQNYDHGYYKLRAEVELQLGDEVSALQNLKSCLQLNSDDLESRESAIELAGRLGLVDELQQLFSPFSENDFSTIPNSLIHIYIRMLGLNKLYGKALDLCERAIFAHKNRLSRVDFYLAKVDLLRRSGKKRAGEQLLRQLLNDRELQVFALLQLVENGIEDHELGKARQWFDLLNESEGKTIASNKTDHFLQKKRLARIRLIIEEGEADKAMNHIDETLREIKAGNWAHGDLFKNLVLAEKYRLYLSLGNIIEADEIMREQGGELELSPDLVALRRSFADSGINVVINSKLAKDENSDTHLSRLLDFFESESAALIDESLLAKLDEAKSRLPGSVRATNISIDIASTLSDYKSAIELVEALEGAFPAEQGFCRKKLELLAKSGKHQEALENFYDCYPGESVEPNEVSVTPLTIERNLFYARLLWGNKQYEDALAVYSRLLEPPIYQFLIDQFNEQNLDYQYLNREQTFWNSIILFSESDPEIIAQLMRPQFLVENKGTITGNIVADNFEIYSWQRLISDEFLARKAIFNRNYNFAARSYEKLIEQDESTENKIDLASIYSRIGEYRKEAQVYEEITSKGEVTPELEDSIAKNILQIRPTATIDAELEERDGREGVVNIRKKSLGTTLWFTPDLKKDFWLEYKYNTYETVNRVQGTSSNRFFGSMSYDFSDNYELIAGIGTEKFTDSSNSETQYNLQLTGQLDDYVSGFVLFQKEPVDDSVASLEDNISRRIFQTGLTIESELGVTFGGDLEYSLFSDDNERNRFYLFSSYSLFGESLRFDMRYSFQYMTNKDINGPEGIFSEDVNNDIVKSYWSPESFSEHRLGFQVKKDFFGYLTDVENKLSYFLVDTGISLEDEENVAYSARFNIFLEMSQHLLLKGNFSFHSSDVYDEKLLSVSLHYSW